MTLTSLPLYNFNNGSLMIIIFAFVCLGLIGSIFLFMTGSKEDKDGPENTK
ncbi:hypothetical protein [Myroides guanonis]|uniref:hypothetical protein n=1 Tax=Myroides guanonis TaxID=1150112 RepID=UPI0015A65297|nr:hypothetical protein [Myroides guanonis]